MQTDQQPLQLQPLHQWSAASSSSPAPQGQVTARSLGDQEIKKVSQALEESDYVFRIQRETNSLNTEEAKQGLQEVRQGKLQAADSHFAARPWIGRAQCLLPSAAASVRCPEFEAAAVQTAGDLSGSKELKFVS